MSINRFYALVDGRWKKLDDNDHQRAHTDNWVGVSHGANALVDERYYFSSLADAQEFYREGWKGTAIITMASLANSITPACTQKAGRLTVGPIYGDAPSHEDEGLRGISKSTLEVLDEDVEM